MNILERLVCYWHKIKRTHEADGFGEISGNLEINIWKGPSPRNEEERSKFSRDGLLAGTDTGPNLVVNLGKRMVSRMIAGNVSGLELEYGGAPVALTNVSNLFITQMRWGEGGANPTPPPANIDPISTDEALYVPISAPTYKAVTVDFPASNSIRFTASLEQGDANGSSISEEGLFCVGEGATPFMFARRTFGVMTKTPDFSFEFRHTIIF